jgi:hypothetical protein
VLAKWFSTLRGHHQELGVVEPFWEAQLVVLVAVVLYVALPARLTVGPRWLVPSLEGVLLVGLAVSTPYLHHTQSPVRRRVSIGLMAIVTAANFAARACSFTICSRVAGAGDDHWSCRPLRSGLPTSRCSAGGSGRSTAHAPRPSPTHRESSRLL